MYLVLVGAGKIGTSLLDIAVEGDHDIVIIEENENVATEIGKQYDCMVINADATARETLREAGIDQADALITTTDADAVNLMVCTLAREFDVDSIVSVIHDPTNQSMFRELGIHVMVTPSRLIAKHLYRSVQRPSIQEFVQLNNGAEVFEITVADDSPLVDRSLREAKQAGDFPDETIVVSITRDDQSIVPDGDTHIKSGDLVTVFSGHGSTDEVTSLFTNET